MASKLGNTHDGADSDDDLDGELHGGSTWVGVAICERGEVIDHSSAVRPTADGELESTHFFVVEAAWNLSA